MQKQRKERDEARIKAALERGKMEKEMKKEMIEEAKGGEEEVIAHILMHRAALHDDLIWCGAMSVFVLMQTEPEGPLEKSMQNQAIKGMSDEEIMAKVWSPCNAGHGFGERNGMPAASLSYLTSLLCCCLQILAGEL